MDFIDFFDQSKYLAAYPDLQDYSGSPLRHYILHGAAENRLVIPDARLDAFLKATALDHTPPDHLITRVHGSGGEDTFTANGKTVAFDLDQAMQMAGIKVHDGANVLDFGCGPGRVLQWFSKIYPAVNMYGCDIDPEPITWLSERARGQFIANGFMPPLPYDDQTFDIIYSISVFTHLPEEMQFQWLEELRRITKPGGYLLLTVHGAHIAAPAKPDDEGKTLERDGFRYAMGGGVDGLPDFYQNAYHTVSYIHREWSRYFDVRFVLKRGINNHQDLVICRV